MVRGFFIYFSFLFLNPLQPNHKTQKGWVQIYPYNYEELNPQEIHLAVL